MNHTISPDNYESLRHILEASFPDHSTSARVTDEMVDHLILTMQMKWHPEFGKFGITSLDGGAPFSPPFSPLQGEVKRYYLALATHTRMHPDGSIRSQFTGRLPVVHVELRQDGRAPIMTPIGQVDDDGALYFTVEEFNRRLANEPGFVPAKRVELITPPRLGGERFAAVAVYLAYGDGPNPHAYLLEAGLAQGGPRVPYYGQTMDTVITKQTTYKPTPMAEAWHWYVGTLKTTGDRPTNLHIEAKLDVAGPSYIAVDVNFEPRTLAELMTEELNPAMLRFGAFMRVTAISKVLGVSVGDPLVNALRDVLGAVAEADPALWIKPPT